MARPLDTREPHPLDHLEEVIVRVTTLIALAFLAVLILAGLVTGERRYFVEALNPAVTGLVGLWLLWRGNPRVIMQLVPGAITLALVTGLANAGSRSGALLGLLSMGIVAPLLVRRRVVPFIAASAVALFATAYWWNVGDWQARERAFEAMIPAFALVFTAGLVTWLKRELVREAGRRRDAADSLAASEEQFRTAFETSAAMMALVSLDDGRFLEVNEAASELLGYSEEELLTMSTADVTHPDDRAASRERALRTLQGEISRSKSAIRYLRKDGSVAHGLVSAALVTDSAGKPSHFVTQLVDLTEQIAAEERLMDLLASRDELIASVSHELRTPLTAVLGYAGILLEAAPGSPPDDYEVMLREIYSQGRDLVGMIEDLLVFAQGEDQEIVIELAPVDVRDQITLVLESLRVEASVDHVQVLGPRLSVVADPLRLRQVLRNLLSNAVRYGGESIVVQMRQLTGGVEVIVGDNGRGVPPEDRELIFEPYQRSRPQGGLTASIGVGLTVARRLARLMDGDLTYRYVDERSEFVLLLQRDEATALLEDRIGVGR